MLTSGWVFTYSYIATVYITFFGSAYMPQELS
jgi:hypothetical protein